MMPYGLLVLIFILISGLSLKAQENELSLSIALQKTLENNYGIIIQEADLEIAGINNNWGTAGRYPTIGFTASTNNSLGIDAENNSYNNRITTGLGLNWTIFDGFRVNLTREKLNSLEELSQGRLAVVVEGAIEDVIMQYYYVLLQKERLTVLEKLMLLSRDRYDYTQTQKDLGGTVTYVVLQSKNNYLNDRADYLNQEVIVRNAIRNLNFLMGEEPGMEWNFTEEFQHLPQDYNFDDLLSKTMSDNHTLQNQFIQLKLEQNQTAMARGDFLPSLSLAAGANDQLNFSRSSGASTSHNSINPYANISLSFNIYSGGNRKRAVEIAEISEEIVNIETDQMEHSITNQLMNEFDSYNVRKLMLEVAEESLEAAELNLGIAEDKLKSGVINSFNYRDIQMIYLNSALNRLNAIYNLISSNTTLTRLTGGLIRQ